MIAVTLSLSLAQGGTAGTAPLRRLSTFAMNVLQGAWFYYFVSEHCTDVLAVCHSIYIQPRNAHPLNSAHSIRRVAKCNLIGFPAL